MKLKWMAVAGIVFLAVQVQAEEAPALKTQKERMSYGLGVDVARNFQRLGLDLDPEVMIQAVKDVYSGGKLHMSEEDLRAVKSVYQIEMRQKQVAVAKKTAEESKKAGSAFLAENKGRDGVVTLPSGLQYKILKAGDGRRPTNADTVECHYRGTLLDGTEFDSSYGRGKPAKFSLRRGIIEGWREALMLMSVGAKWQLFVPPPLAYGQGGNGRYVGPNATLVYELELVAIK
jgi:FKBP-type peptidyl-prolyl cis-trans isomerase FklB